MIGLYLDGELVHGMHRGREGNRRGGEWRERREGREGLEGWEGAPRTKTRSAEIRATAPKMKARLRLELLAWLPLLRERLLLRLLRRLDRAMF